MLNRVKFQARYPANVYPVSCTVKEEGRYLVHASRTGNSAAWPSPIERAFVRRKYKEMRVLVDQKQATTEEDWRWPNHMSMSCICA